MGKSVGLIGEISGKVGNVVFFTRNGVQVTRVYVRHPNNPKTSAQNRQRLKVGLAGRLSSIVPAAALEGLAGSRSERRSRFLKSVLLATSAVAGKASVSENDVVFSEGSLPMAYSHSAAAAAPTVLLRRITITTRADLGGVLPAGYGERFVVLFLNTETSQYDYAVTGLLNLPSGSASSATTDVGVRVGDRVAEYIAIVYVYPFSAAESEAGSGTQRISYVGTEDGTIYVDALTGEVVSVDRVFGRSMRLTSVNLPAPAPSSSSAAAV